MHILYRSIYRARPRKENNTIIQNRKRIMKASIWTTHRIKQKPVESKMPISPFITPSSNFQISFFFFSFNTTPSKQH